MEKLDLRFVHEKETRNTCRYQEEIGEETYSNRDIAVGFLYVQKECLGDPPPRRLKVIIEEDEG